MRKALVIGNWKMNGQQVLNKSLVEQIKTGVANELLGRIDVGVCPPAVYAQSVIEQLSGVDIVVGAQNMSEHDSGAFTGEVSAVMLKDIGCGLVILGHSERRALFAETNVAVAAKVKAALAAGLMPVVCVGETLEQREAGKAADVVREQLDQGLAGVDASELSKVVIAYEPVWAIGTGLTASPEQAQEIHHLLRKALEAKSAAVAANVRLLYGGSVNAANAEALFAQPDIDGGLIGGASLKAEDFIAICRAAAVAG
ncbi:triose-phosphate isomerase [Marinobacterium weihaiense]|uniref:Triosephosphate isomerase n=1 Tax=Marinobacterium weihaiense TaxID=2851016 RepID=A0ABS6MD52_9GAMM|nr:triose-phosphate isomerase [Marinobacterium weihaiense]MBV0934227.1 triose-phosphate isomerase [Marinobacterium weihaiense]